MVFVVVSCLHLVVITAHVITVITHRRHGGAQRVEHDTRQRPSTMGDGRTASGPTPLDDLR